MIKIKDAKGDPLAIAEVSGINGVKKQVNLYLFAILYL